MRRLPFLIFFMIFNLTFGQSPHGKKLKVECDACHSGDNWKVNPDKITFNHNKTDFPLSGQHQSLSCRSCHKSLEFSKGSLECRNCHTDMHNNTVGFDCSRCHSANSWIVPNITRMHEQTRFPLVGRHATADCYSCHPSGSLLQFEPLGIECYDCHKTDYLAAKSPDHQASGFSTNCLQCHNMNSPEWLASGINHSFFPLQGGHAINCTKCHVSGTFQALPKECNSCHNTAYNQTTNPSHSTAKFPIDCQTCHSVNAWKPATFNHDGQYFPIYSGRHRNEWTLCSECHANPGNFTSFTCLTCHEHNKTNMDNEHKGRNGYSYTSTACYSCHPRGNSD